MRRERPQDRLALARVGGVFGRDGHAADGGVDDAARSQHLLRPAHAQQPLAVERRLRQVVDERGDGVTDYNLALLGGKGSATELREFALDVHAYGADRSLRCFHVDVTELFEAGIDTLAVRLIASSGSTLVGYHGAALEGRARRGQWEGTIDLSRLAGEAKTTFFYPFTTTLLEIRLNREPLPLTGPNEVCRFLES